jgi:23S rRNA (adenine2503-C2)-methyltransferase
MSQHLHQHGVLCKLRRSAGQDVDGACGQLRARNDQGTLSTQSET